MNSERNRILTIDSKSLVARVLLVVAALLVIVFVWFSVSWQLGNLFADFTKPTETNAGEVADMAIGLAPRDPLAVWLKAVVEQDKDASKYQGFEDVIRLSPMDYRWWVQMGRAFEQADKPEKAELAFERAIEIAPNYVVPRWRAGNFFLRGGREEEGLANLKRAAEFDPVYREQVFSVVWEYFEEDDAKLLSLARDVKDVYAGLAKFYAAKEQPRKSLAAWNKMTPEAKKANQDIAKLVAQALFDKGFFATSVKFRSELSPENGPGLGRIHNSGFEKELSQAEDVLFSWRINRIEGMRVQTNGFKKRTGRRSLELSFSGFKKPDINNVYQTVAVRSGVGYRLSFWVKTEKLSGASLPLIQVINTIDSKVLASSPAFSAGSNDWTPITFEFEVPDDSEGISIRTAREFCGDACTLTGTVFYDDFELSER